ncbi:response regulator [Azospirillum sp. A29]|uniref:response regulator n=1 Tax=Azospirillum sp. A29 TaxID=3160606 RepID=UPI003671956B
MTVRPHIILAEDEELVAAALAEFLETEGFRVTITHDGVQALEAEEKDAADLLLTDMRMPVLDGEGLIRSVRAGRPNRFRCKV